MAGDVAVDEELVFGQPVAGSLAVVEDAAEAAHAHVLHEYGKQVAVVQVDAGEVAALARVLPRGLRAAPARITKAARQRLSDTEELGLEAFERRTSAAYAEAKAARPLQAVGWDEAQVASAPGCAEVAVAPAPAEALAAMPPVALSDRLSGSVAVGLVIVEGPTADLRFSAAERATVVAETQNGLTWLGGQHPVRPIVWRWDIDVVQVDVSADPNAADLEERWRDPAMATLGYGAGVAGVSSYAADLREQLSSDWAFVAFFTKYPLWWFAYAWLGGPSLVMHYENDGWGPENIDRVFAHEVGHIFNAPDEYAASGCDCGGSWGHYSKPNSNCASCASGGGVDCIMRANSWTMCDVTPYHLGLPIFADVGIAHPHVEGIAWVAEQGITSGFADGTFRPADPVTRGQMASFLTRGLNLPPGGAPAFPDVPADHVHAGSIAAIVQAGITSGFADGTFRPQENVTRGQMATFLMRALM